MTAEPTIPQLMDRFRDRLPGLVRKYGGDLLRFESISDLMQEIEMHLVRNQGAFEYRGDGEFLGFLSTVAERVLINRRKFWNAQRRFSWNLLRLEWESRDELRRIEPVTPEHSPSSIFNAKLRYQRLVRAVALLPEMDREVLAMLGDGCTIEVTAARLGRSSGAAAKLRQRAVKRLAKAYRLVGKLDPDSDGHPPMEVSRD